MAQIRETVELLCKILKENGTSPVKAEVFRLSKFDNPAVTADMWKMLFEVIYFCNYGENDTVCFSAEKEFTKEELVVYTKKEVIKRGHICTEFAGLPTDMSKGSRAILLAFGFILWKESAIPEEFSDLLLRDTDNIDEKVQQLLCLNNKLRYNLRSLLTLQKECTSMQNRMHRATTNSGGIPSSTDRPHLSTLEIYMLNNPDLMKTSVNLLDKDNKRLQHLIEWKSHHETFFLWMDSVLQEKLKSYSKQTPDELSTDSETEKFIHFLNQDYEEKMKTAHDNLHEVISKYQHIVDHLEENILIKDAELTEEHLDNILQDISFEVAVQKVNIALKRCDTASNGDNYSPVFNSGFAKSGEDSEYDFLNPPALFDVPALQLNTESGCSTSVCSDLDFEMSSLKRDLQALQTKLMVQSNKITTDLEDLSSQFSETILTPPISARPTQFM
ncbi:DgyrCDS11239 [Dimorphilus gyrociliatus]|uniref:DgyrCDS11239 n=1 Tax=Dimorphilus gyrociliatus TaxID=2664684 RepID=A0A7I8W4L4_9ANNE|nr:DgyrCDS11239 [Dimorphilus gyrociliatus]